MSTQTIEITNVSGGDFRTIGGLYSDNETKSINIVDLIVNPHNLIQLKADIDSNDIDVVYNGTKLYSNEIELVLNVIATHAQAKNRPVLNMLDVNGGAAVAAAGGDIKLVGQRFLRNQVMDSLQLTEGAADLTIKALKPGVSPFSVEMIEGVGVLAVTFIGYKLTIELAAGGSSDDAIATEINKNGGAAEGYLQAISGSGGNFTAAQAEAQLAGGVGNYDGNRVMVGGLEALPQNEPGFAPTPKWTNDEILVTTQAVGLAGDVVNIEVEVDGMLVPPLSAVLV